MPGVLIVEAMAQAGGILLLDGSTDQENNLTYLLGINNAKFRKMVFPGDQLVIEVNLKFRKSKICQMEGKAFVEGELVAEAEILASMDQDRKIESREFVNSFNCNRKHESKNRKKCFYRTIFNYRGGCRNW